MNCRDVLMMIVDEISFCVERVSLFSCPTSLSKRTHCTAKKKPQIESFASFLLTIVVVDCKGNMIRGTRPAMFACCALRHVRDSTGSTGDPQSAAPASVVVYRSTDPCFDIKPTHVRFGAGAITELGREARRLGMRRVLLFTDPHVNTLEFTATAKAALVNSGVDVVVYAAVSVEPTDDSFERCGNVLRESRADGVVSVGGGSVIDSAKAAIVWAACDPSTDALLHYFNKPVGDAKTPPRTLLPHIACPTTCGTGSECTPIAICDVIRLHRKTGIVHRAIAPTMAMVDPRACLSLPPAVIAASGFDVLSHAVESYTAKSHHLREQEFPVDGALPVVRPTIMGRNRYTSMGCLEALRCVGASYERAVHWRANQTSPETAARLLEDMAFASTLAGTAIGTAGCHIPHAMSYPVSGNVPATYVPPYPYPGGSSSRTDFVVAQGTPPVLPHGMAVSLHTPAVMRMLQDKLLDAEQQQRLQDLVQVLVASDPILRQTAQGDRYAKAPKEEAGHCLSELLVTYMKAVGMPSGLYDVGFQRSDVPKLASLCMHERRLLQNAPFDVTDSDLTALYSAATAYW